MAKPLPDRIFVREGWFLSAERLTPNDVEYVRADLQEIKPWMAGFLDDPLRFKVPDHLLREYEALDSAPPRNWWLGHKIRDAIKAYLHSAQRLGT